MGYQIEIFQIVVLVFSAIIHEYMHGWMANELGDPTAKDAGRLSLNPLVHIDPFGSIFLPFLLIASGSSFVFGWAKPVPFNPFFLKDREWGPAKVAIAGPLGNLITAVFFGLVLRFVPLTNEVIITFFAIIVQINLLLMVFNLVPIPPMDGSKVLLPFLPPSLQEKFFQFERYGLILVLLFVMFGFGFIIPIINFLFRIIVGA